MKLLHLITFLFFICFSAKTQNLVPNPSFEKKTKCPNNMEYYAIDVSLAAPWFSPNIGSPDYYHECNNDHYSVPNNDAGFQWARTGKAYAGFYAYAYKGNYYRFREYIAVHLNSSLVAGQCYYFEMYVSLANTDASTATDELGAYFSNGIVTDTNKNEALTFVPQVTSPLGIAISDTLNWTLVSGTFTASGGENSLIIGCFKDIGSYSFNTIDNILTNLRYSTTYYLIDDVSLIEMNDPNRCEPVANKLITMDNPKLKDVTIGQRILLSNVIFKTGSYELSPVSYEELDKLVKFSNENPKIEIEIAGHTDNIGQKSYNLILSENRAKAVIQYLKLKDIDGKRLTYIGYGSSKSIDSNMSEAERKKNRRVEILLKK